MNDIIPGILEQQWNDIEKKLELISRFSKRVHIDLLDGIFANNSTFSDPAPFAAWADKLDIELHMMVKEPVEYIDTWGKIGVKRFLGHVEMMSDQDAFVQKAKSYGEVGLALDGKTRVDRISVSDTKLDCILVMTIDAGFSGQTFVHEYAAKCEQIRTKNPDIAIEVDGGIHVETLPVAKQCGANRFVCTSALFQTPSPENAYNDLLIAS
jgi:ribulose-phosphate 3-epimerase